MTYSENTRETARKLAGLVRATSRLPLGTDKIVMEIMADRIRAYKEALVLRIKNESIDSQKD